MRHGQALSLVGAGALLGIAMIVLSAPGPSRAQASLPGVWTKKHPLPTVRASMRPPRRDSSDTPNLMLRCGNYCSATPCDRMHTKQPDHPSLSATAPGPFRPFTTRNIESAFGARPDLSQTSRNRRL